MDDDSDEVYFTKHFRRARCVAGAQLPYKPPNTLWDIHFSYLNTADTNNNGPDSNHAAGTNNISIASSSSSSQNNKSNPSQPPSTVTSITPHKLTVTQTPYRHSLVLPALAHPHIHLDKAFLHFAPEYADLIPTTTGTGSFHEALSSTRAAKSRFTDADLLRRGRWLLASSVAAGVGAMRAFVEVDRTVGDMCLRAGLVLKEEWRERCFVQIAVFAQEAVFSHEHRPPPPPPPPQQQQQQQNQQQGSSVPPTTPTTQRKHLSNRELIENACRDRRVDVVGSTPYAERDLPSARRNIEWAVDTALRYEKHLDFHLDYNLDPNSEPLVWHVLETLKRRRWTTKTTKKVMLGHCTRLTLFSEAEWKRLAREIHENELPVTFVGLPTSDIFMASGHNTSTSSSCSSSSSSASLPPTLQPRGTLHIPTLIRKYNLDAVIGINNVGNAFTPQGTCDPLSLACLGVGIYQTGTHADAELLYECVSTRARAAMGLDSYSPQTPSATTTTTTTTPSSPLLSPHPPPHSVNIIPTSTTDLLLISTSTNHLAGIIPRPRTSAGSIIWEPPPLEDRRLITNGRWGTTKGLGEWGCDCVAGTTVYAVDYEEKGGDGDGEGGGDDDDDTPSEEDGEDGEGDGGGGEGEADKMEGVWQPRTVSN
ncbi:hypothetical protein AJ80_07354 [Polytolypa hystricis UAMH7299]|uniref:Amidohydrolase-related domain-containing protein n=1 Tax=Polytolypa hystricis (strain UAMH7299) TaxID=1447883 RepID=A0A2B7XQ63_POLH7|nr:hypothetical protein AJ80_07354 [Polytolypa hystricis UAMH7299]